jgi:hypothetical protein
MWCKLPETSWIMWCLKQNNSRMYLDLKLFFWELLYRYLSKESQCMGSLLSSFFVVDLLFSFLLQSIHHVLLFLLVGVHWVKNAPCIFCSYVFNLLLQVIFLSSLLILIFTIICFNSAWHFARVLIFFSSKLLLISRPKLIFFGYGAFG